MRALAIDTRLEAIAGPPAGMQVEAGSTGPLAGFTALGPRSLYVVYDVIDTVSNYSAIAYLGTKTITDGQMRIYGAPIIANWGVRFDLKNGSASRLISNADYAAVGRNVASIWLADGATSAGAQRLGSEARTVSVTPGDGMPSSPVLLLSSPPGTTGLLAAAYPAVHTEYQRNAIMRKLLSLSLSLSL